ncbi:flagellar hook-length control protein FliK [Marichromatium gracile]|uniref:flagellar hook-length control protein FliK n=1 Tax=Marichromatium gracile TaxID=1048 RepID=UPI001F2FCC36|nr:flagellar hook-length control protein FliK [Marichromatium gracile]MCF1184773.1 flagellar hook-length control protein FliK [Marichromatium gracile]
MQAQTAQLQPYGLLQLLSGATAGAAVDPAGEGGAFTEALEGQLRELLSGWGVDLEELDSELQGAETPDEALASLVALLQQLPTEMPSAAAPTADVLAPALPASEPSTGEAVVLAALQQLPLEQARALGARLPSEEVAARGEALLNALQTQLNAVTTAADTAEVADGSDGGDDLVARLRGLLRGETSSVELSAAERASLAALLQQQGGGASTEGERETLAPVLRSLLQSVTTDGGDADPEALLRGAVRSGEGDDLAVLSLSPGLTRALQPETDGSREFSREALFELLQRWGGHDGDSVVEQGRDQDSRFAVSAPTGAGATTQSAGAETSRPLVLDFQQLLRPGGERALVERMQWLARAGEDAAEIKLHPPSLGALEVRVAMEGDKANVQFFAANPVAREVLEAALPRLRDSLAQEGMSLGEVTIADQPPQQRDGGAQAGGDGRAGDGRDAGGGDSGETSEPLTHSTLGALSQRLDLFV